MTDLQFIPVTGGYSIHLDPCACTANPPDAPLRPIRLHTQPASLTEAVAHFYRRSPVGITSPDRFTTGACALSLPPHVGFAEAPASWASAHEAYMSDAAGYLWDVARLATRRYNEAARQAGWIRAEETKFWVPSAHPVRIMVRVAHEAAQYNRPFAATGATDRDSTLRDAEAVVGQAEIVINENLERLLSESGGEADYMDRAYTEATNQAARAVVRDMRIALSMVHAHRALRTVVQ